MGLDIYAITMVGRKVDKELVDKIIKLLEKSDKESAEYLRVDPDSFWKETEGLTINGAEFNVDYDYDEEKVKYFGFKFGGGWWQDNELKIGEILKAQKKFNQIFELPANLYICPRMSI